MVMQGLIAAVCAATLVASASVVPVTALPLTPPPRLEANGSLVQIKNRCYRCYGHHHSNRHYSGRRYSNRHYSKRNYSKNYNNNRNYRNYNYYNGWDYYYDDWWPGLFFGGAIIGPMLYQQPYLSSGSAHIKWCYRRFRSYRASDNTYQPYHGRRRQCVSPYGP
jgi:BA14K-like protein